MTIKDLVSELAAYPQDLEVTMGADGISIERVEMDEAEIDSKLEQWVILLPPPGWEIDLAVKEKKNDD